MNKPGQWVEIKQSDLQQLRADREQLISERDVWKRKCELQQQEHKKTYEAWKAQVAVLRGALETATDYLYNPFEPDNQCAQYKSIKNTLETTPAEAAERVQKVVEALESTADDIGIEVNNLQDVHNVIVQSAVHHLRDVVSGIDKALAEWNKP